MTTHIAIIGGGASGTLLAANIRRYAQDGHALRVTIIDPALETARGLAYSTRNPSHLLNVRASQISGFADEPDHFLRWLAARCGEAVAPDSFVPRDLYGQYLEELLADVMAPGQPVSVRILHQECTGLRQMDSGVEILLADGSFLPAHYTVIASGFGVRKQVASPLRDAWSCDLPNDANARVLVIGSGLSMVDKVLSLLDAGHQGPIHVVSRRGLMPQAHGAHHPLQLSTADIPLGASVHYLTRWLRQLVRTHQARGGDWRDVMDGLRPHNQAIWRHLSSDSRARFLRHAAAFWDVHRHRMPPAQSARIEEALRTGQLTVARGRFNGARAEGEKTIACIVDPSSGTHVRHQVDIAYDCRGVRKTSGHLLAPFVESLIQRGQGRLCPHGLGLEFDPAGALLSAEGVPSSRIFGIGPVTMARNWETIAIPDIRVQARRLAEQFQSRRAGHFASVKDREARPER